MAILAPNMLSTFWPCFDEHESSNFDGMIKEFEGIASMYSSQTGNPKFNVLPLSDNEYHRTQEHAPFFTMLNREFETTLEDFVFSNYENTQSVHVQFTKNENLERMTH